MCGLITIVVSARGTEPPAEPRGLVDHLRHRGPDGSGQLTWTTVAGGRACRHTTGHTRLAILDPTPSGSQPMATADGRLVISFNGEVYNYRELGVELRGLGHELRTGTDTEVILAAYAAWGTEAFRRFEGMFAMTILDRERSELVVARDRYGIKPLFVAESSGHFAVASEIPALLDATQTPRVLDPVTVHRYLTQGVVDADRRTFLRDVASFPPGEVWTLDLPGLHRTVEEFRRPDAVPAFAGSRAEAVLQLRQHFERSIELHLRSDVPVGAALSGGIDSSSIVMGMRSIGGPRLDLTTVSYIAGEEALSERRWVDLVTEASGARAIHIEIEPHELERDLDDLIRTQGQPFGSTSIYAQFRVFRAARQAGIPVMLDGQGADELFGGYRPYVIARIAGELRRGRVADAVTVARGTPLVSTRQAIVTGAAKALPLPLRRQLSRLRSQRPDPTDPSWFSPRIAGSESVLDLRRISLRSELDRDFRWTSLPGLLRYEDHNSMRWSVEGRVPFLFGPLVDHVRSLPDEFLIAPDGTAKSVLRDALRGLAPDPILDRRDKIGFATPEQQWMRSLAPAMVTRVTAVEERVRPLFRDRPSSLVGAAVTSGDANLAWRISNLALWSAAFGVESG